MKDIKRLWATTMWILGLAVLGMMSSQTVAFAGGGLGSPLGVPHVVQGGTPAKAVDFNENFQYLVDVFNKYFDFSTEGVAIDGHLMVKSLAPLTPKPHPDAQACSPNTTVTGTDSVGTITIGSSTLGCVIDFGTAFSSTPICMISSSYPHTSAPLVGGLTPEHFVVVAVGNGDSLKTKESINYICVGINQ